MLIELIILAVVATVVFAGMRFGKAAILDNPVIIHQPGQYHITLAPQLNCAHTFIENIARQFAGAYQPQGDIPTQYFEVCVPDILARGENCYLLAAAFRGGMLYFQAINPKPLLRDSDSHLKTLREFSGAVLALRPLLEPADQHGVDKLCGTVESVAHQLRITVKMLGKTG